jgi:hypothetical protein
VAPALILAVPILLPLVKTLGVRPDPLRRDHPSSTS